MKRKEQQRNSSVFTANPSISLVPLISSLKGMSVTSSNNKVGGEESGVKLSLGKGGRKGGRKVFSLTVLMFVVVMFCFSFCSPIPKISN